MKQNKIILTITTSILLMGCHNQKSDLTKSQSDAFKVDTMIVKTSTNGSTFNYSGQIEALKSTPLSFESAGNISKINIEEGSSVHKGQVIAELDKTTANSAYQAALATKKQAEDAYERLKSVYEKGSLAEIKWEEVKAKLEQAKSTEQIAAKQLKNCVLTCPTDGFISQKNMEIGMTAIPGVTVAQIVDIRELYVKISVSENEISKLKKGTQADINIAALDNKNIQGKIEIVGVAADPISKTYEIKIKIANRDSEIKPGMVCDVNIKNDNIESFVSIPSQIIKKDSNNNSYVYVVDPTNKTANKRYIQTGRFEGNNVVVTEGLIQGEILVKAGHHKMTAQTNNVEF
ncbi:MAG: efflux RND transporter periplasmic adaptor subunit [Bacteroidales bacterium]|nr:efflux RND transporter periplasmic adaptor subunit [Bacteroidales bacterium]